MESRLWADLHGFQYWETSASSGAGIGEMFQVGREHKAIVVLTTFWCVAGILLPDSEAVRLRPEQHQHGHAGSEAPAGGSQADRQPRQAAVHLNILNRAALGLKLSFNPISDVTLLSQSKMNLAWNSPAPAPAPSPEQAGVMARLRTGRDPWEQLGLPPTASRYCVAGHYRLYLTERKPMIEIFECPITSQTLTDRRC